MTLTNLIDAARQYAQSEEGQLAAMDALLAGHTPQKYTPLPPPPEPQHLVIEYHHEDGEGEPGRATEDLIGAHFVGPMAREE